MHTGARFTTQLSKSVPSWLLTKNQVAEVVAEFAKRADIKPELYGLQGDDLTRNWTLRFSGLTTLAAQLVGRFLTAQRSPSGAYEEFHRPTPWEAVPPTRVFFGGDRNQGVAFLEKATAILGKLCNNADAAAGFSSPKADHAIYLPDWTPIARIVCDSPGEARVRWSAQSKVARDLAASGIEALLVDELRPAIDRVQWSGWRAFAAHWVNACGGILELHVRCLRPMLSRRSSRGRLLAELIRRFGVALVQEAHGWAACVSPSHLQRRRSLSCSRRPRSQRRSWWASHDSTQEAVTSACGCSPATGPGRGPRAPVAYPAR